MKTALCRFLVLVALCFTAFALSQTATVAPTTGKGDTATKQQVDSNKKSEDTTVGDLLKAYELSTKKTDFTARQISLQKTEDVATFVKFLSSDQFQGQRVVLSNLLDVKDDKMKTILTDGLSKTKDLRSLAIAKIPLGAQSCFALASLISSAPRLEKIHLYRTRIGADCVKVLIDTGFKKAASKTLTKIVLVENPIGDQGFKHIVEFAVSEDTPLTGLVVRDGKLTVTSAKLVEQLLLGAKPTLTHVDVSENPKLSLGFQDMMNGLSKSTVTHFEFNYGELSATHAPMITQMLTVNKKLLRLDIGENEFGNKGAIQIAQVLANSSLGVKIQRLDLSSCEIEDDGTIALVKALQANSDSVGVLYLFRNEINNVTTQQLLAQQGDKIKSEYMSEQQAAQLEKEAEEEHELSEIEGEGGDVDEEEGSHDGDAEDKTDDDEMIDEEGGEMEEDAGEEDSEDVDDMDTLSEDETENDAELEGHSFLKKNGAASANPKRDEL